ncbi:MAG: hypothetical protein KGL39_05355 [Patescibacteria group bacterium]|nr:hypothetical protein [Patescibacteria group bacterium]
MISALANIPRSPEDWRFWAWHHRDSHNRIRGAILKKFGINLTDYQVEPIDPNQMTNFLQNNASLHGDMNSTLGLQSADLEDANLGDDRELEAWIRLHWLEHNFVELKLGV